MAKVAGMTRQQLVRMAQGLPEDQSALDTQLNGGWTISQPQTYGDLYREGELMSNCWSPFNRAHDDGPLAPWDTAPTSDEFWETRDPRLLTRELFATPLPQRPNWRYLSLRDADNIPHASFHHEDNGGGVSRLVAPLGRHNDPLKSEYVPMLRDWAKLKGIRFVGDVPLADAWPQTRIGKNGLCDTCGDPLQGEFGTHCPRCQWSEHDPNLDRDPLSNPSDPFVDLNLGITPRTSSGQVMYHVAPEEARVTARGALPGQSGSEIWGEATLQEMGWPDQPPAVYLFPSLDDAHEYANDFDHIHEVDVTGLALHPDAYGAADGVHSMYTTQPIPPERIRRIARVAQGEVDPYWMQEACGSVALAAHRMSGWPIHVLYDGPDIAHVYVVHPDGQQGFDAKGLRPITQIHGDFPAEHQHSALPVTAEHLSAMMSDDDDEAPLYGYDPDAEAVAERIRRVAKTAQWKDQWQPGEQAHFEYHCHRGHDSDDRDLWYRSHQPVTILKQEETDLNPYMRGELPWDELEYGGPMPTMPEERMDAGMPLAYTVRFPDGLTKTVMEDELYTDPQHFDPQGGPPPLDEIRQYEPAFKPYQSKTADWYHMAPTILWPELEQGGPETYAQRPKTAAHQLSWMPGQVGKGILTNTGEMYTWPVDRYGEPHHADWAAENTDMYDGRVTNEELERDHTPFFIEPDGQVVGVPFGDRAGRIHAIDSALHFRRQSKTAAMTHTAPRVIPSHRHKWFDAVEDLP